MGKLPAEATIARARAESERLEHLVFGRPRPGGHTVGRGRSKRKIPPLALSPGIEEAVALREQYGHRQGTPETHAHLARRQHGALARLYCSSTLDRDQLAYAEMIRRIAEQIRDQVAVRTASLETRVDVSRRGGQFFESLAMVRDEQAFTAWRSWLQRPALVLDIIIEDLGLAAAARRHHLHHRKAAQLLILALNAWPMFSAEARSAINEESLARAHERLN
jgi:hypothetical protein